MTTIKKKSPFNREAQQNRKRQAILDIAARLFNTKGARATTLVDIAKRLNLTKTSLYYYVKTKEELVYLCYKKSIERLHQIIDEAEESASTPLSTLDAITDTYFAYWLDVEKGREPATALLAEIHSLKEAHKKEISDAYRGVFTRIQSHIENGVKDGTIMARNPLAVTHAYMSTILWSVAWLPRLGAHKAQETSDTFKSILRQGLASWSTTPPKGELPLPKDPAAGGFDKEITTRIKQDAFIKTASELFNQKGVKASSLDEISERLNVTKGAFYYHIENKDDLLMMCFGRTIDMMIETYKLADAEGRDGLTKLFLGAARLFAIQNSEAGPLVRSALLLGLPKTMQEELMKRIALASDRFGSFIREGLNDHSIRPINAQIATEIVIGTIMGSDELAHWQDIDDLNTAAHDYLDFIVFGIEKRKDT